VAVIEVSKTLKRQQGNLLPPLLPPRTPAYHAGA